MLKTSSTAEPLLTCVDKQGRAGGLGLLTGGYTYQCSTHAAQRLLSSAGGKALEKLGESVAFELVVGFNGRCWIDAATAEDQIVVARTLAGGGALY